MSEWIPFYPPGSITTPCPAEGCRNRLVWDFYPGEPMTYEHPGTPDEMSVEVECSDHPLGDYRPSAEHDAWQQAYTFDRICSLGNMLWISSLQHIAGPGHVVTLDNAARWLGGTRARQMRVPMRPVWESADEGGVA